MASFGKVTTAFLQASQETTLAFASLNFDFALIKYEAPEEYKGLGESLSQRRKDAAEDGASHITARKLSALFHTVIPEVPHLIQAYGQRATEIAKLPHVNPKGTSKAGVFADHIGADGTTIWATATSGDCAITMHLLACILARIWTRTHALSIWSELIEQRKEDLRQKIAGNESSFQISDIAASRIDISRSQLDDWDASARSWLQTADEAKKIRQTQLRLILDNVSLPVSNHSNVSTAVIEAWTSALIALERLINGMPQRIQDGAVLLGLSAWHLYPDMSVLGDRCQHIKQGDPLISPGGIITIGLRAKTEELDKGIFWSLPLAHMYYYGDPIFTTGHAGIRESHVTFNEFMFVVLGSILAGWNLSDIAPDAALKVICTLSQAMSLFQRSKGPQWLALLASAAAQVILDSFNNVIDLKIGMLRSWALRQTGLYKLRNLVLRYQGGEHTKYKYTNISPIQSCGRKRTRSSQSKEVKVPNLTWVDDDHEFRPNAVEYGDWNESFRVAEEGESSVQIPPGPGEKSIDYTFICGDARNAAIFAPTHQKTKLKAIKNEMNVKDLIALIESGDINPSWLVTNLLDPGHTSKFSGCFQSLQAVHKAEQIYSHLQGARVDLQITSIPLGLSEWGKTCRESVETANAYTLQNVFSCIALFETGFIDIDPTKIGDNVIAMCNANSIFVACELLLDPTAEPPKVPIERMTGNIGKPGLAFLITPCDPKLRKVDFKSWNVINHEPFTGRHKDSFASTSLHLSFTGYELPLDFGQRGTRDAPGLFIETTVSIYDREFLDQPLQNGVVRVHGNAMARLATAALAAQQSRKFLIMPEEECWQCLSLNVDKVTGQTLRQYVEGGDESGISYISEDSGDTEEDSDNSEASGPSISRKKLRNLRPISLGFDSPDRALESAHMMLIC